ncbi:MAG TPA: FAD-binding and (Fe-S)-binding domain-containing protein [Burkholderiales bacterium]|nr:FAD-binding and (Fe-S)-binding domain-containing protein [Burkholderiales bacterium]
MPVPSAPRQALARELARSIQGEVRFDPGSRALYATDASNYRQVPIGVVIPKSKEDVIRAVEICRRHGAAVLPRGGGTSLCGQCCNVAVVIDFSKYLNRILEIDPARKLARVEPGCVNDDLRNAARRYGLTFAPDPATHNHNTLGGMVGNNSCGPHSVMGGETTHNVIALEVLTYDGKHMTVGERGEDEIFEKLRDLRDRYAEQIRQKFPPIPRRVSGYNLPALLPENGLNVAQALVGSEGTCVTVLEATLRLVDDPPARSLLVLGYPDVYCAGDHVPEVMRHGPIALEGIDDRLIDDMKAVHLHPGDVDMLPEGRGWLLVEFGGKDKRESDERAHAAMAALEKAEHPPTMRLYDDPPLEEKIWKMRESGLGATAHPPEKPLTWEGWEDSSVPPENLGKYLRELRRLFERYGYECDLYGHFGQGCVHTRIDFDLETAEGIGKFKSFLHDAAKLVTSLGGSISGEHGDGQSKAELLPIMFGEELMRAFREFKAIWDPDNRMNPGKIVDAYRVDENLRLGTRYAPPAVGTWFRYPDDGGDPARAALRCVGVGECRKHDAGTMCPSYMATREEMHSTRGRARLLWEALNGNVIRGWKDEHVKQALDLCLSCKGCKGECPVKVDMATYKAEYFAHYYKGRIRPLNAYAFGYIDKWSRVASHLPGIAGWAANSALSKALLKIPKQRTLPRFAAQPFTKTFRGAGSGRRVILWPDTFNNYFHPEVAHAAAEALARAGCEVHVPSQPLCCGRPLYEFGLLDSARSYLKKILGNLHDDIQAGTPIVGLEPACVSVFKEELPNLLAHDEQAHRLSQQVHMLSDFLVHKAPAFPFGQVQRKAVVHGHCHHKSVLGMQAEEEVLRRLGLDFQVLDSGCCGMAGSFGFEEAKYDVSVACAERVLLPSIKELDADTLVMTNGFSCRAQIEELAGRRPLHLAEVLKMSL